MTTETKEQSVPKVPAKNFMPTEFAFANFSAVLPVGWKLEDALEPEAWAHVASQLSQNKATGDPSRAGAIIEVRTEDHAFYARLYVRAVRDQALEVAVIGEPQYFGPKQQVPSKTFDVRWNVGARGFDVIRTSDKAIVGKAFPTKEEAYGYIEKMAA